MRWDDSGGSTARAAFWRQTRPHEWLLVFVTGALAWRYFWMMDDSFIYFRYVDNWLFLGRGLVYNAGEYVEGYTSPAWLLLLASLRRLSLDYGTLVRWLGVLCAVVFALGLVSANRRMSPPDAPIVNAPLALAATHYGVLSYFTSGLETPLVQLGALAFAFALWRPDAARWQVSVAALPLVRPELALASGVFAGFYLWRRRRVPWTWLGTSLALNGGWLVFRVVYYADLLPNTYYLKAHANWPQGWLYLRNALEPHFAYAFVAALAGLCIFSHRRQKLAPARRGVLLLAAGIVALWVARVGGDFLYQRFLAFSVCLALVAAGGISEAALASLRRVPRLVPAGLALTLALMSFFSVPPQLLGHPWNEPDTVLWHGIGDAMWHRRHPTLGSDRQSPRERTALEHYRDATPEQLGYVSYRVDPWCQSSYAAFDAYVLNSYGLTDGILARIDVEPTRPGHKPIARYARELKEIYEAFGGPSPDVYRVSVDRGAAPRWVEANLSTIEQIANRTHNRHRFFENLRLASKPIGRIAP